MRYPTLSLTCWLALHTFLHASAAEHGGNDIGGCEGLIDVVSACDGLVVSARGKAMEGYTNAPFYKPHGDYDYVYVLDEHGWFYRYAHLQSIDDSVQPGKQIKAGEKIGVLGKEGSSGGWAHLHFDKHYVVLRRGPLEAVIVDNAAVDDAVLPGHRAGYHGLASLKHTRQQRNIFVPAYAGLNFEHIHDGRNQSREILFEPRFAPMELHAIDDHTAELHQPPTPHWGLESWMRYELLDHGVVEMKFACVPRRLTWKNNYLGLFWANYIDQPESLDIHFLAAPENNWIRGVTPSHGVLATHRSKHDHREFPHDADFPLSLVFNFSKYRYAEPWYFGACRGMAFVQLFRGEDQIRLSQSPSGGGSDNPAWDFQYFISEPKVGQRYELVMRALYTPLPDGKSVDESRQEIAQRSRSAAFVE